MADNLNEGVEVVVADAEVITVPIDSTLTHSNEAADAKAVGDALALKADKSELQNAITVNGQEADAQGQIIVTAEDTKMSDSDSTTVKAAINAAASRTAEDIPVSSSPTAQTIAQALASGANTTADQIRMSATDTTTVKARIDAQTGSIETLQSEVSELDQRTGATIPYKTGDTETIMEHVDALEAEKVKTVNGEGPDVNGNIALDRVPFADNLYTDDGELVGEAFLIRTTAGSGSLSDGEAWAQSIEGRRTHDDFVPEVLNMTVNAVTRPVPPAITATLDADTFEAYVGTAGTYTLTYGTAGWSADPYLYGLTISNDPVTGDVISITWDGTNNPVMTISAAGRVAPPEITAEIDRDTFVSYVSGSGTVTLNYTTGWSADPALYGITVNNAPYTGDQIVVVYVEEVRGTIVQSDPTALTATGWNLYDHTNGYARCVRYSETYGYMIQGTYTSLAWAETITGTRSAITPSGGLFQVPGDGYIFVTGGNATDTAIFCTWSDWTTGPDRAWEAYTESGIDFSAIMSTAFPYGLCQIVSGTMSLSDEIDLVHKLAISRITRMAYSLENLAAVRAAGRLYEYDEDYIYQERETYLVTQITLGDAYTVSEHGLEWFEDTPVAAYAAILYGTNLKDKLKRDVITISPMELTGAQQAQVRDNIAAADAGVESGLAIIVDGDTAAKAVAQGAFAYLKNNTHGLSNGLYKAKAAFPATGGTADSTAFEAVEDGGLNSLNDRITTLFKRATYQVPMSWYSTANPFVDVVKDVTVAGYTPISFDWFVNGTGATTVFAYNHYISSNNSVVLGLRMNQTPATVDQNSVTIYVLYAKNGTIS